MTHSEHLKKRILSICYVLCLLALGYVAIRVLAFVQHAVFLLLTSVLLAYLLKPLVALLHRPVTLHIPKGLFYSREARMKAANYWQVPVLRTGLPWLVSIAVVYAVLICVVVLVISFVVPVVNREFKNLVSQGLPALEVQLRAYLEGGRAWLIDHLPPEAADTVPDYVARFSAQAGGWAVNSLNALPPLMGKLVGAVVMAFLIPILTFYLLMDTESLHHGFMTLFPSNRRADAMELASKIDDVLARYIRGQLAVACIIGTSISIVLHLLGLPYAVLIGIFAGFINLIPYVGTPLGMIPAFLVAFFMPEHGGLIKGCVVVFAMYCVYLAEGKVIVPTIVGKSVGLPPLIIILSLIAGAEVLGVAGMLLAVPTAAVIRVVVTHLLEKRDRVEVTHPHHTLITEHEPTSAA